MIPVYVLLPDWEQNALLRRLIPGLPAVNVSTQLPHAFCGLSISLQIFITVPASVIYLARRVHQIRGYCWPHRLHAATAAQSDRQNGTQCGSGH